MKTPIKKTCSFLILTIAFALTLAMAGDVVACPCINTGFYSDPSCSEILTVPPIDPDALVNGRLWYGTDIAAPGPGGAKNWSYHLSYELTWDDNPTKRVYEFKGEDKYKVIVTGALSGTNTGTFPVGLITGGDGKLWVGGQYQTSGTTAPLAPPDFWAIDDINNGDFNAAVLSRFEYALINVTMNAGDIIPFTLEYLYDHSSDLQQWYYPTTYPNYGADQWNRLPSGFDLRLLTRSGMYYSDDCVPVPEPATMLLLGSGLIGLAGFARRKFKK